MTKENYYFWGVANREPPPAPRRPCDPRLLKQLGVRREVCEAAARAVEEQAVGE